MSIVLYVLSGFVILATFAPLNNTGAWWVRAFDFPRPQITTLGIAAVPLAALWIPPSPFKTILLILLLLALVYQAVQIFPYTPVATTNVLAAEQEAAPRLRLLTANVLMSNRSVEGLKAHIETHDPDVILLVETDAWWQEQFAYLNETHSHTVQHPLPNTYGMLLFSRHPFAEAETQFLVQDDVPSIFVTINHPEGVAIRFIGIHPRPPRPDTDQDSDKRDAELLIVGRMLQDASEPVIVAGDLNDVAWSHTSRLFQRISELMDPRKGRGFFNTFPVKIPLFRYPLDHVFHSDHFRLVQLERLAAFGSDHFPILIELSYEPTSSPEQEEPKADQEDLEESTELIARGLRAPG